MARRSRFRAGGAFQAPRIGQGLNYTKTWDASPYIASVWIRYLKERPEYNAGWKTMVDNMIAEIADGGAVNMSITKDHGYDPVTGIHTVNYSISSNSNLDNSTNHPDLMSEYINNMEDIMRDYANAYRDSEGIFNDATEEWETRKAALERYENDVEDLMAEID
jgi:hypothetical protein